MFRTLDIHPAFGFETFDRWRVAVHQRDEALRIVGRNPDYYVHRLMGRVWLVLNNASKVLSYIPRINKVIGLLRIFLVTQDETNDREKKAIIVRHIYRGAAEICLGCWLLPLDIFQTVRDSYLVESYLQHNPAIP
ncbi:MAG: hypothetical protein LW832_00445 [Parachlamydia sp.]|jgi:hypothetical protein|nr:hypothetical protein [Parachlamydia sp.]